LVLKGACYNPMDVMNTLISRQARHGPSKHRAAFFLSQETEPTFASLEKQPALGFNNIHVPFSRHPFVCRVIEGSAFVWISHVSTIYKTHNPAI
jgi:hypothetical protein